LSSGATSDKPGLQWFNIIFGLIMLSFAIASAIRCVLAINTKLLVLVIRNSALTFVESFAIVLKDTVPYIITDASVLSGDVVTAMRDVLSDVDITINVSSSTVR
jgi:hypothetical protein